MFDRVLYITKRKYASTINDLFPHSIRDPYGFLAQVG